MRKKKVMKTIAIVLVFVAVLIKLFPTMFWKAHDYATKQLQVKLVKGKTDLEYEYGQDWIQDVSMRKEKEYTIFYPTDFLKEENLPIVVWANGTGNTYKNYEPSLKSLASYGFIVVGCEDDNMGDGKKLYNMALYMKALNENQQSMFYHHLNVNKIGAAGHSQGACGAINAATKYEESETLFASLFTTSLPKLEMCVDKDNMKFSYWRYDISKIKVPYFGNTGTRFLDSLWISPLSSMKENFILLPDGLEAYMARQIGANHNIVNEYHGCGYFNAWFCYTLKDDEKAKTVFAGDNPEILRNTKRWKDVLSK